MGAMVLPVSAYTLGPKAAASWQLNKLKRGSQRELEELAAVWRMTDRIVALA